jgi:three-Cys-motif partner protein
MRKSQKFGGAHTKHKLDKLEDYLRAYSTALKNKNFELVFFDAFAGTGDIQIGDATPLLEPVDDFKPFIEGSATRALRLGSAFAKYVFVEKSKKKIQELNSLAKDFPDLSDRIELYCGDANESLKEFCARSDWNKVRAVVFLDPFGNQVEWSTLEAMAATKAIDVWYLFPAGLGVHRQIGRDGSVHFTHGTALDRIFGTSDWRKAFLKETTISDLFDGERLKHEKIAGPKAITEFMIERLRDIFQGGVLSEWVPLGSNNTHMYSLIFAWGNPGKAASDLANRLARSVIRSKDRGRSK